VDAIIKMLGAPCNYGMFTLFKLWLYLLCYNVRFYNIIFIFMLSSRMIGNVISNLA